MGRFWWVWVLGLAACEPGAPPASGDGVALDSGWHADGSRIASVSVHSFRNASTAPESLLAGGELDLRGLEALTTTRSALDGDRHAEFLAAALGAHPPLPAAACYIPHHMFLLRDGGGTITGAVEVCFSCRRIRTVPEWDGDLRPDWMKLAAICETIGVGLGPDFDSLADFEASLSAEGL